MYYSGTRKLPNTNQKDYNFSQPAVVLKKELLQVTFYEMSFYIQDSRCNLNIIMLEIQHKLIQQRLRNWSIPLYTIPVYRTKFRSTISFAMHCKKATINLQVRCTIHRPVTQTQKNH